MAHSAALMFYWGCRTLHAASDLLHSNAEYWKRLPHSLTFYNRASPSGIKHLIFTIHSALDWSFCLSHTPAFIVLSQHSSSREQKAPAQPWLSLWQTSDFFLSWFCLRGCVTPKV